MSTKRIRDFDSLDMAKCLIFLSQNEPRKVTTTSDFFECKTCNKRFSSFQALGGHRASHKKPKLSLFDEEQRIAQKAKPQMHKCSICGAEFALGQALGGHMRRHRDAALAKTSVFSSFSTDKEEGRSASKLPVLRRLNSSKRVFGLDLNLTPLENDLEYLFGKRAPKVDLFL